MTESKIVSIPLIKFSASLPRWPLEKNGPEWNSFPSIHVNGHELNEGCYGVKIEDESMTPVLKPGMVAVFSSDDRMSALMKIYSIGRKGDVPLVRKVVKNEIPASEKRALHNNGEDLNSSSPQSSPPMEERRKPLLTSGEKDVSSLKRKQKRKSFMTPTPLHIPGSRVSPIAESTHQMIFLKSLANPEKLILVPGGNLLWMHPLVLILKPGEV